MPASIPHSPTSAVVVTGGGSGIGRACVLALAEAGRGVAAWDLDGPGAEGAAAEARDRFGVASVAETIDVTDSAAFEPAIARAREAVGPIGGLVHAAGVGGAVPVPFLDEVAWDAVQDVNLRAEALLLKALLPSLREALPGAAVVGISSVEGLTGNGMLPAYCASKAGLLGFTRSAAHAFGPEGIRVNAVCPGAVDTPMLAPLLAVPGAKERVLARVPLNRIAAPEDIARVVRFLLSDDAAYITGTAVVVDGGMTAAN